MMIDLMTMFSELMTPFVNLVTMPFSLCKWVFIFGLRTLFVVIHTWVELVKASISFHLNMFHKTMIWMIALISLPMQVLTALQRERLLQEHLHEMHTELDSLSWDREELQGQLQTAVKECKILESMLAEVEEENDRAITKIELLESEFQDLKVENRQLKEILYKDWSFKEHGATGNAQNVADYDISDGRQSCYKGSGIIFDDLLMHNNAWEGEHKREAEWPHFLKTGYATRDYVHSISHCIVSRGIETNEGLDQRRDVALSQSLFSAVLSLLVGMIIWEAEDSCVPLVIALFAVVIMSLKSVVQFFSTIKNKPAADAVALLSFNWFILGTLTYPALPAVVRLFAR